MGPWAMAERQVQPVPECPAGVDLFEKMHALVLPVLQLQVDAVQLLPLLQREGRQGSWDKRQWGMWEK